jgi:GNAT superfamily N-acetyltransferase
LSHSSVVPVTHHFGMPELTIRSATPADIPLIADLYDRLSPSCFAERFMAPRADSPLELLAHFDPDRGDVVLLVALTDFPDLPIAEARYSPTGPDVAEFAMVVHDAYQGEGVGKALLDEILKVAAGQGLNRLAATVSGGNTRMLRLLGRLGWALVDAPGFGVGLIEVSTDGGMPGWPEDGRRRILVESRSWFGSPEISHLSATGAAVRRCPGPRRPSSIGVTPPSCGCPLVMSGVCRLAEDADEIVDLLPDTVPECAEIRLAHEFRWPERLHAEQSALQLQEFASATSAG